MILPTAVVAVTTRKTLDARVRSAGKKQIFTPNRSTETVLCRRCEARFHLKAQLGFNWNKDQDGLSILWALGENLEKEAGKRRSNSQT